MQARKSASQYAHLFIAATLISGTLSFTATLAHAQASASTERDAAEQRRAQERETRLREQQERTPDVRLPTPAAAVAQSLPESETPCFTILQVELRGEDAGRFDWLQGALGGPEGASGSPAPSLACAAVSRVFSTTCSSVPLCTSPRVSRPPAVWLGSV